MKPIAMKCTQKDWEGIKLILEKNNINIATITDFKNNPYLVNNFEDEDNFIVNLSNSNKNNHNRTVYEQWDKNIFLDACDIKLEEEFVLPEKWFVRSTPKTRSILVKWRGGDYIGTKEESVLVSYRCWEYISKVTYNYKEITFEQFCKYVLKQEIKEINMDSRFPFSLSPENAEKIIDSACSQWKTKLAKFWAVNIILNQYSIVDEEFYKEMRKACTAKQNSLFDNIFGKDTVECSYKVDDWIHIEGRIVKITAIIPDIYHKWWIKHTPNAHTGGGFGYDAYKDKIRLATEQEISKATSPYKNGELVWVKNSVNNIWDLRYTTGIIKNNGLECYNRQQKNGDTNFWDYYKPATGIVLPD